jgi:cyclic pyranopterin phosphate synthase
MSKFSHFNKDGKAHMVDVSSKEDTNRIAIATGNIFLEHKTLALIQDGNARVAAIQATKKTSELIPLCHNIFISKVNVEFNFNLEKNFINCEVTVQSFGKTGVEMEALTGVSIGLLTIYDMCKAVDRKMTIKDVRVLEKKGGKSGDWNFR